MQTRQKNSVSYEDKQFQLSLIHAKIETKLLECQAIQKRFAASVALLELQRIVSKSGSAELAARRAPRPVVIRRR